MKFNLTITFGFIIGYVFLGSLLEILLKGNIFMLYDFLIWADLCLIFTIIIGLVFKK